MRFMKTRSGSGPTRFLHVTGAGSSLGTSEDSIRNVFNSYGQVEIVLVEDKRFCFIVYQGETSWELNSCLFELFFLGTTA